MSNPDLKEASRQSALNAAAAQRNADYNMIQRGLRGQPDGRQRAPLDRHGGSGLMLRTAKPNDTGRIVDLLAETHARSRYAALPFDRRFTYGLVAAGDPAQHGDHDGGCLVVVDVVDQRVEAFIIGTLSRVYLILDALSAKDLFLIASDKASPMAARKLLGRLRRVGERNPKVYEIELTHTDVTPESERIGEIYERMGFEPFGHAYRRSNPAFAAKLRRRHNERACSKAASARSSKRS
jgi:hypothetical protein